MKFAVIISALLLFVGCSSKPITSGMGVNTIDSADNWQQHLKVDNPKLAENLVISDLKTRLTNEFLEVNLTLASRYPKTQNLQYKFNWFDADGFAVEPDKTAWQSLALHGMQQHQLRALAPTKTATKFNIYVRDINEKVYKFPKQ